MFTSSPVSAARVTAQIIHHETPLTFTWRYLSGNLFIRYLSGNLFIRYLSGNLFITPLRHNARQNHSGLTQVNYLNLQDVIQA